MEDGLLFLIGILLVIAVISMVSDNAEWVRLIAECMEDGRKEYECISMLK